MPFGGLLTAGIIGGSSLLGSLFGANAASTAANEQVQAQEQALQIQQQEFGVNQANQAPFVQAGQGSIQALQAAIQNGTYGPGSIPSFALPTLQQAEQTPGYQFNLEQGNKGILQGAAAAGGAVSGGTLKALAGYDTNLASTTYQQQVQNALSSYQAQLAGQQQGYNQLANVASLGENAAANVGNSGVASTAQIGNTLGQIGTAQASGTVGVANAVNGGLSGIANAGSLYGLYQSGVLGGNGGGLFGGSGGNYYPNAGSAGGGYSSALGPATSVGNGDYQVFGEGGG